MRFRWEFRVTLSGFGGTAKEAWVNCQDNIASDGMSECPCVKRGKALEKRLGEGYDVAYRCEADPDSPCPEGALLTW